MRISYTDWWNDVVALLRANASILIAIAGAFIFLPVLAASFVTVPLEPLAKGATADEAIAHFVGFYTENWLPQLLALLLSTLGQLLVFIVLLDRRRPPVGEAFRIAAPLFLPFFITSILVGAIVGGGMLLFIVPGLYLVGRTQMSGPALVAEGRTNPVQAVARSFALTKGQGWRIFFFAILVFIVALVVQVAVSGTLGTAIGLLAGDGGRFGLGRLLLAALDALFASLFFLLAASLWVTLYRRLAATPEASRAT